MEYKQTINQILTHSDGLAIDVFYEIYAFISSLDSKQQFEAFSYMCENAKGCSIDENNLVTVKKHFTKEKVDKYLDKVKSRFVKEIESIIFDSSKNGISSDSFYEKVWNLIQSNKICKTKYERALATFTFVDNALIPYIPVGTGLSMDDDKFNAIIDSLDASVIKETELILQIKYNQKTQKSSLVVEKMQKMSFEEQSVYLSIVFDMLEERIKEELKAKIDSI